MFRIGRQSIALCLCLLLVAFRSQDAYSQSPSTESTQSQLDNRDLRPKKTAPESNPKVIPRGYALIVGIGRYANLRPDQYLSFTESDAEAIYQTLISQAGGAFPPDNVHRLIGNQATLSNLKYQLETWLPSVAQEQDRVVVYFAGHGFVRSGHGYIAPYDVNLASVENTAYPMNELGSILAEKVKARWKVLLTDACHSGKITPETTDDAVNGELSNLPRGFLIFSATRAREKSYEDPTLAEGFGVFSYFLAQGLRGNADESPCDGAITADELIEYVRTEVKSYAKAHGVTQTPTDYGDFDNNMILGVNPKCVNTTLGSPAPLGSLVIESNLDNVKVYLDGNSEAIGTVQKDKPLRLPGLSTGIHSVRGVKDGYEPETKEVMVSPGQERAVVLRIQYRRVYKRSSIGRVDEGEPILFKINSSFNPLVPYKPNTQSMPELKRARSLFEEALKDDPTYAKAAFDLALTCQLLSDEPCALAAFRNAVEIDPGYVEARVQYAGALIESGDPDAAIRQLTEVLRFDPQNDIAYSHLARAYLDKGVWNRTLESASRAIQIRLDNDEAYLWRADALRRSAAEVPDAPSRLPIYDRAMDDYRSYIRLTSFHSPSARIGYYLIGFGVGSRAHADRQLVFDYQHSMAFLGLCDCEVKLGNFRRAISYCDSALKHDPSEPLAYFFRGNAYRDFYNLTKQKEYLLSAQMNYSKMVSLNPDLDQSQNAKNYLAQIGRILKLLN